MLDLLILSRGLSCLAYQYLTICICYIYIYKKLDSTNIENDIKSRRKTFGMRLCLGSYHLFRNVYYEIHEIV